MVPSSSSAQKFLPLPRAMREYFLTVFLSIEILIKPLGPSAEKSASRDWFFLDHPRISERGSDLKITYEGFRWE